MSAPRQPTAPRPILWFARDLPNVCSLAGLLSAVLGVHFAIRGVFPAAMIALLWASFSTGAMASSRGG